MTDTDDRQKLVELMQDMPIAMLTTLGTTGPRSVPMARQAVDAGDDLAPVVDDFPAHRAVIEQAKGIVVQLFAVDAN